MDRVEQTLARWLEAGGETIGEIAIRRAGAGFALCHRDDVARGDLALREQPEAACALATADDAGAFRPLKTAPNLRHGWRLVLPDLAALRCALDYFYPAMLGVRRSHAAGRLEPVPLRATLGRQTGMYRVTLKITDADARTMIDDFCAGCLKQRLWEIDGPNPQPPVISARAFPLLCHEACNLLVARAREVVKKAAPPA